MKAGLLFFIRLLASLAVLFFVVFGTGCGGGSSSYGPNSPPAANNGNSGINNSTSQTNNGGLTLIASGASSSVAALSQPRSIVVDPSGSYAYVANYGNGTVSEYQIGSNGVLSAIGYVQDGSSSEPASIAVAGSYVYVANYGTGAVSEYQIGSGGALSAIGSVSDGLSSEPVSIAATGSYVYVANYGAGAVSEYQIDAGGALSAIGTLSVTKACSVTADLKASYVYVANLDNSTVDDCAINSDGSLTVNSNGSAGLAGVDSVMVNPIGSYAYMTDSDGSVYGYQIGANGALTSIGSVSDGPGSAPRSVAVTPGKYLYVANSGNNTISEYQISAQRP